MQYDGTCGTCWLCRERLCSIKYEHRLAEGYGYIRGMEHAEVNRAQQCEYPEERYAKWLQQAPLNVKVVR